MVRQFTRYQSAISRREMQHRKYTPRNGQSVEIKKRF